ncbi:MAG: serine/threonine-protein kinase [Planctomycetota bacterium]
MHCTDGQLIALMEGNVVREDPDDEARAIAHLEECNACRQRLELLSGEGDWLQELVDSVRKDTGEFDDLSVASSVVVTTDIGDPMEVDAGIQCDAVRLDFLEPPTHPELLGRLGRYDIEQLIGMGGFGVVFKARDSELNRIVAIKVLAPHLMSSGPARKRFAREAQASAAVVHDHVVAIYDVVSLPSASYFVMQFAAGESLQQRVDREGPLEIKEVLRVGAQMAAGLQAAHEQGLIHRDVKPANVLLEDAVERVLISDFGLARTADDASITRSGVISGTPHYMSPEQSRGETIDARSDLFSLGSVLYFMCTGHPPFRAPRMMAVLNRICTQPHRDLMDVNEEAPRELAKIVDRLLAKDPETRYDSAQAAEADLHQLLRDIQSGNIRRRPRRLPKIKLPSSSLAKGVGIAALGLLVIWFAWLRNDRGDTVQPLVDPTTQTSPDTLVQREDVELIPPGYRDAFEEDFGEKLTAAQGLVNEVEVRAAPALTTDPYTGSWNWDQQLGQLNAQIDQMETQLGVEMEPTTEPTPSLPGEPATPLSTEDATAEVSETVN